MRSPGFTLVEVLVALCVLALGAAGAAATQLSSARLRQQAALASDALQLAASLGARMRLNVAQMALADGANPYLGVDYDAAAGAPAAPAAHCFDAACDPAQLAAFDLYEAARGVHEGFPGGRMRVCRDGAGWDPAAHAFVWTCSGGAGAPVVVKLGWRAADEPTVAPALVLVVAP